MLDNYWEKINNLEEKNWYQSSKIKYQNFDTWSSKTKIRQKIIKIQIMNGKLSKSEKKLNSSKKN